MGLRGCIKNVLVQALLLLPRAYFFGRPEPSLFCHPEPLFCHPEQSEGSLGACKPREDRVGNVAPNPSFVTPSEARGPAARARLGKSGWEMSPRASFFVSPRGVSRGVTPLGTPSRLR